MFGEFGKAQLILTRKLKVKISNRSSAYRVFGQWVVFDICAPIIKCSTIIQALIPIIKNWVTIIINEEKL